MCNSIIKNPRKIGIQDEPSRRNGFIKVQENIIGVIDEMNLPDAIFLEKMKGIPYEERISYLAKIGKITYWVGRIISDLHHQRVLQRVNKDWEGNAGWLNGLWERIYWLRCFCFSVA
jgi:hypothetical protein